MLIIYVSTHFFPEEVFTLSKTGMADVVSNPIDQLKLMEKFPNIS